MCLFNFFIHLLNKINNMPHFKTEDLNNLDKISRLNLVNSCTGYKSANLIGSISKDGIPNLAIFSSVTHLGSNPAMLGFIVRPTTVPRHTFSNIKETEYFTVNAVTEDIINAAHQTSAAYSETISEFEATGITPEYKIEIDVPFVKNAPVQLLCKYINEYPIKENNTIHVIAKIEEIFIADTILEKDGWVNLDLAGVMAINGLDGYAKPILKDRFEYARPDEVLKSKL